MYSTLSGWCLTGPTSPARERASKEHPTMANVSLPDQLSPDAAAERRLGWMCCRCHVPEFACTAMLHVLVHMLFLLAGGYETNETTIMCLDCHRPLLLFGIEDACADFGFLVCRFFTTPKEKLGMISFGKVWCRKCYTYPENTFYVYIFGRVVQINVTFLSK